MVFISVLKLTLIVNIITRRCDSSLIKTNHNLGSGLSTGSLNQLCSKLADPKKTKRCNIISCIGAKTWKQRYFVEKTLGLDPSKSSTLSGPLKPRNYLWEENVPEGYNLVLDSEIPSFKKEYGNAVNSSSLVKLSALSKLILIYLNEEDFKVEEGRVSLKENVKGFFEKLSKRLELETGPRDKNRDIYLVLPNFNEFKKEFTVNKTGTKSLEKDLKDLFPKKNLYVKYYNSKLNLSKYLKLNSTASPNEVVEALKSFVTPNMYTDSLVHYLTTKSFENFNKFVDNSLEKALQGTKLEEFANQYQSQLMDSRISYFLLVMEQLGRNFPVNLYEFTNTYNARMCLDSLIQNLESEIKSEFAKYFGQHRKEMDINLVVDQFIHQFKSRAKTILPLMSDVDFRTVLQSSSSRLEKYMYHMNELYTKFPNNLDSENGLNKSAKRLKDKIKFNPRFQGLIQLVGVLRDRGSGNARAFLNYNLSPFLLTLGYANDRNLVDDGSGTGTMAPPIKVQPIIHLKVNL